MKRKKVVHAAVPYAHGRRFAFRSVDDPWRPLCGSTPIEIRLSSYKGDITCAHCLTILKNRKTKGA